LWKVSDFLIIGSRSYGTYKFQTGLRKTGIETSGKYPTSQRVQALKSYFACRYIEKSLLYPVRSNNLKKEFSGLARSRTTPKNRLKKLVLGVPVSYSLSTASWKESSHISFDAEFNGLHKGVLLVSNGFAGTSQLVLD
jgi:hypothetical protein